MVFTNCGASKQSEDEFKVCRSGRSRMTFSNLAWVSSLYSRFQWLFVLRRGSTATRLRGLRVRIPLGAWLSVSSECRALCEKDVSAVGRSLVQRSHTHCDMSACDLETWAMRTPLSPPRLSSHEKIKTVCTGLSLTE